MSDISERVKKIIVEHLDVDAEKVKEEANLVDDLGADSLEIIEVVLAFEDEFDIDIQDDDAQDIQTVEDAINFIKSISAK